MPETSWLESKSLFPIVLEAGKPKNKALADSVSEGGVDLFSDLGHSWCVSTWK